MLFSAVRNWLSGYGDDDLRHQVEGYLGSKDLGQALEPRLALTAANNVAFQKFVIASIPLQEIDRSLKGKRVDSRRETLVKAALFVNRHIVARANNFDNPDLAKDYLLSVLRYLSDNVNVVRFVLASDDAAYTIFETLNDRGLELGPLDLVKNYLFSQAEKSREGSLVEFEARWTEMMTLLSSSKADSFLRAFWSSRHAKPEGAKLFTAFKKAYSDPKLLYGLSVDMRQDAERYAALFSSRDPIWTQFTPAARASIDALGVMGFSQAYPIILSALDKFPKGEMERLLWLIECVAVRHQLIGRRRPGRVESLGGRAAKDIFECKINTATSTYVLIRELYVPDDEFKLAFENHEETNGRKIKFLLTGVEREAIARDSHTLTDELTTESVTVEHIFPRSPSQAWSAVAAADANWDDSLTNRLGNLCLLPSINHSLGNKEFSDKLDTYKKSRLRLTKGLDRYAQWGRVEILSRQKHMAELAVSAWRFQ